MEGSMKSSDISDERMLQAVQRDMDVHAPAAACTWTIAEREGWPLKIVGAKLDVMMRRRSLVDGCNCGCRGDWTITDNA